MSSVSRYLVLFLDTIFKLKNLNPKFVLLTFIITNVAPVCLDYAFGDKDGKILTFNFSVWAFLISLFFFPTLYGINIYSKKKSYPKQWLIFVNSLVFLTLFLIAEILFLIFESLTLKNQPPPVNIWNPYFSDKVRLNNPELIIDHENINFSIPKDQKENNVNIKNNLRTTAYQPLNFQKHIYVFGGSTIFSLGVSDSLTICSYLQKKLNDNGYNIKVNNVGVIAATLTQQIQRLKLYFEVGNNDIIIFFDGINDITEKAYYSRNVEPKIPIINYQEIIRRFKGFAFGRYFLHRQRKSTKVQLEYINDAGRDYCNLLEQTDRYLTNKGALFYHFLQPNLFTKMPLNEFEEQHLVPFVSFWTPNLELVLKKSAPIFDDCSESLIFSTNLNSVFNSVDYSPYIDFCHLTHRGNQTIANEIYEKLLHDKALD